jgi:hypothetical protein
MRLAAGGAAGALLVAIAACTGTAQSAPARITTSIPWAGRGVWLQTELHTHTTFSDGLNSVDDLVAAAAKNACDVLAITDHSDGDLKGGTPEYLEAIRTARSAHPGVTVIAGMEWNVPPGKGQEHANVLFPAALETADVFGQFKERFDDQVKKGENPELALAGFAALAPKDRAALAPVVIANHPSRRPESTSAPSITFEALKKAAPSILIGFEGAPGHQRAAPLGAYPAGTLVARWDPLAANVNGAWDRWLQKGIDVWAAFATTDFHAEAGEFWPCEFGATWVYAPDRTGDGVIRALRAGSFFGEHGHIAKEVELEVAFEGMPRRVHVAETAATTAGAKATVTLRMKVPPTDYLGRANRIDTVELIGVSASGAEALFSGAPGDPDALSTPITVPAGGLVLRARGRRSLDGGEGLMFYTNPIRLTAPAR